MSKYKIVAGDILTPLSKPYEDTAYVETNNKLYPQGLNHRPLGDIVQWLNEIYYCSRQESVYKDFRTSASQTSVLAEIKAQEFLTGYNVEIFKPGMMNPLLFWSGGLVMALMPLIF